MLFGVGVLNCLLFVVVRCSLCVAAACCCLLWFVGCSLGDVCWLLIVTCCVLWLVDVRCVLFVVCC